MKIFKVIICVVLVVAVLFAGYYIYENQKFASILSLKLENTLKNTFPELDQRDDDELDEVEIDVNQHFDYNSGESSTHINDEKPENKMPLLSDDVLTYYNVAWDNMEKLNSYTSKFDLGVSFSMISATISGSSKATHLHDENSYFAGKYAIKSFLYNQEFDVYSQDGSLYFGKQDDDSDYTINIFKFGENFIKKIPDEVVNEAEVVKNGFKVVLNEKLSADMFQEYIDFIKWCIGEDIRIFVDISNLTINTTEITVSFLSGYINKYNIKMSLSAGKTNITISGKASMSNFNK